MFERIIIKNFQCHKFKEVKFDQDVTTFVGPTDKGKSAIIRALRWVCLNKAPKNHIRWGAKCATVILFVDGKKITRKQGKGVNYYAINGKKLYSFNKSVPDEVEKLLNIDSTNFQRQRDPDFWISLSAPKVTQELNKIVDLSVIDTSLSNMLTRVRKTKSAIEVHESNLKQHRKSKKDLNWLIEAKTKFLELESCDADCQTNATAIAQLSSLIENAESCDRERGTLNNELCELEKIAEIAEKAEKSEKNVRSLETVISEIEEMDGRLWELKKTLKEYEAKIKAVKKCPLCESPLQK